MRHTLGGARIAIPCASLVLISACTSLSSEVQSGNCLQGATLVVGDTLRDSVTASSCRLTDRTYVNFYRFRLTAQAKLRVSLSSPREQAFLLVSDSLGTVIANSSITAPLDTTAILRLMLKAGPYQVAVNSVAAAPSGPLRLVASGDTSAVRGCLPTWVTTGITTTQALTVSDCSGGPLGSGYFYHLYLIATVSGTELKLTEHATAFTPQVVVVDPDGTLEGSSALDTTGTNALVDFTPASQPAMHLWVGSSAQSGFGQYTLSIN